MSDLPTRRGADLDSREGARQAPNLSVVVTGFSSPQAVERFVDLCAATEKGTEWLAVATEDDLSETSRRSLPRGTRLLLVSDSRAKEDLRRHGALAASGDLIRFFDLADPGPSFVDEDWPARLRAGNAGPP